MSEAHPPSVRPVGPPPKGSGGMGAPATQGLVFDVSARAEAATTAPTTDTNTADRAMIRNLRIGTQSADAWTPCFMELLLFDYGSGAVSTTSLPNLLQPLVAVA